MALNSLATSDSNVETPHVRPKLNDIDDNSLAEQEAVADRSNAMCIGYPAQDRIVL